MSAVDGSHRQLSEPVVLRVSSDTLLESPDVQRLVDETRRLADACIFLSGGAANTSEAAKTRLADMLGALTDLADRGHRIAVGDGGTQTGIMAAAGRAREASSRPFPLIGVAPAPELTAFAEGGKTAVDPNHSFIVAIDNPAWVTREQAPSWPARRRYWGSETDAMYALFAALSKGKPAVTIVANGGTVAMGEVTANLAAERVMVLIAGSGRLADALVSALKGTIPADGDVQRRREQVEARDLIRRRDLYRVVDIAGGRGALAEMLEKLITSDDQRR